MQIYALDINPERAAEALHDTHIRRYGRPLVRLLATVNANRGLSVAVSQLSGIKVQQWVAWASLDVNYCWVWHHATAVFAEYAFRFQQEHGAVVQLKLLPEPKGSLVQPATFVNGTGQPLAKGDSLVGQYRQIYIAAAGNETWTKRRPPEWMGKHYQTKSGVFQLMSNTLFGML